MDDRQEEKDGLVWWALGFVIRLILCFIVTVGSAFASCFVGVLVGDALFDSELHRFFVNTCALFSQDVSSAVIMFLPPICAVYCLRSTNYGFWSCCGCGWCSNSTRRALFAAMAGGTLLGLMASPLHKTMEAQFTAVEQRAEAHKLHPPKNRPNFATGEPGADPTYQNPNDVSSWGCAHADGPKPWCKGQSKEKGADAPNEFIPIDQVPKQTEPNQVDLINSAKSHHLNLQHNRKKISSVAKESPDQPDRDEF